MRAGGALRVIGISGVFGVSSVFGVGGPCPAVCAAATPAWAQAPLAQEPEASVRSSQAGATSDADASRRIRFLAQRLEEGTAAANRWWYAWYSVYVGLTVDQAALAFALSDQGLRIDMAVGALTTSLGAVTLAASPLEARFAAARLRALPESTSEQRQRKLAAGEAILRAAAEEEQFGISWVSHLLGNGVALASGIVLALAYDRPTSGAINFATGLLLTEIQILTQPTQAIDDWREYKRHGPSSIDEGEQHEARSDKGVQWVIAPAVGGAVVAGAF